MKKKEEAKVTEVKARKGFNIKKFETTSFKERTATVKVDDLKAFFEEGEPAEWTVKGLTAVEIAIANEAVRANKNMEGVLSAIASQMNSDKADAIIEMLGISKDGSVPADTVRRFSMLVQGSVSPKCSQSAAVKLGTTFPIVFIELTDKIMQLTGEGQLGE